MANRPQQFLVVWQIQIPDAFDVVVHWRKRIDSIAHVDARTMTNQTPSDAWRGESCRSLIDDAFKRLPSSSGKNARTRLKNTTWVLRLARLKNQSVDAELTEARVRVAFTEFSFCVTLQGGTRDDVASEHTKDFEITFGPMNGVLVMGFSHGSQQLF